MIGIGFSEIRDTVDGAVGYVCRIIAGANRLRDALLFTPPGYYCRPMDEDDDTGTEDAVHVEAGHERIVLGTHNAKGEENLIDYLSRDLDRGEAVITAEDGTARNLISVRPGDALTIKSDSGGGNTITITCDHSTGDLTLATSGDVILDTTGVVKIGDAVATEYATMFTALKSEFDTFVTAFNTHNHPTAPPGVVSTPSTVAVALTNAPRSTKARINS